MVKKTPAPWSLLRKRFERSDTRDPMYEWYMPLGPLDRLGREAWCEYAASCGAQFQAPGHSDEFPREAGVAWDFPVVRKMESAISYLEAEAKSAKGRQKLLLARVIADLLSYRDTGFSVEGAKQRDAEAAAVAAAEMVTGQKVRARTNGRAPAKERGKKPRV